MFEIFTKTFNNHFPESFESRGFTLESLEDGGHVLVNKSRDIRIFIDGHDTVDTATLLVTGVPFLGIKPEEMFIHSVDTLVTISALVQSFRDPKNTEDYEETKTILKILGLLDNGSSFKRLDKSYQKDEIRYRVIATAHTGSLTFTIAKKGLTI